MNWSEPSIIFGTNAEVLIVQPSSSPLTNQNSEQKRLRCRVIIYHSDSYTYKKHRHNHHATTAISQQKDDLQLRDQAASF